MKYLLNVLLLLLCTQNKAEAPPRDKSKEVITLIPPVEEEIVINKETEIIKDLSLLHPAFRNKVIMLLYKAKQQGIELAVTETYRRPERQDYLKSQGLSMLNGGRSKHQHHIAVDVVPVKYGGYMWYDYKTLRKVGKIGKSLGLRWGGDWHRLYDPYHFEYPVSIKDIDQIPMPDTVIILLKRNI